MLQPRICRSSRAGPTSLGGITDSLAALAVSSVNPITTFCRHASHAAQGRANGPKDSAGRRLGAKKTGSQFVIPGNIIFRQRGTKWHPGENVGIGKDHTIYATVSGYVRYYRDPIRHPKRHFIGVALEREGPRSTLPTPPNAVTRRKLGMYASPIHRPTGADNALWLQSHLSANSETGTSINQPSETPGSRLTNLPPPPATPPTAPSARRSKYYANWESNWSIGRTAERKGIKVREYDRSDRWLAWRKRTLKAKRSALRRAATARGKKKAQKGTVRRKVAKVDS